MTTPISDEQLAEVEEIAFRDTATRVTVKASDLRGLIARLRAAESRLQFVIDEEITIRQMNGTGQPMVYQCQWHDCRQVEWYPSPIAAIDAAMERTP